MSGLEFYLGMHLNIGMFYHASSIYVKQSYGHNYNIMHFALNIWKFCFVLIVHNFLSIMNRSSLNLFELMKNIEIIDIECI